IPDVQPPYFCDSISGTPGVMVQAFLGELSRSGTEHVIRVLEAKHAADIERMVLLCIALQRLNIHSPLWSAFAREHLEQAPQDPGAALVMAEIASGSEQWEEVRNRLQAVDPAELDDGRCCHYYHLLGLAFLYLERSAEAMAAFEKGLEYDEGTCFLHPLVELVRPMSDPPEPEEWGPDQPLVRQIAGAIRTADRALSADDPEAALAALDRPPLWRALEVQSAARLAEAWLRVPVAAGSPGVAAERFRKRLGLALFCHLYENGPPVYRGLDLPGLGWESSRLAEIARRAHAWLSDDPEAVVDGAETSG
ncbi:MAG: hypothetical protein GY856_08355, partial [bacterium]|nr:hypothetical protein [bacterium]